MSRFLILRVLFVASVAMPAFAQTAPISAPAVPVAPTSPTAIAPASTAAAKTAAKPDRIICEDEEQIGSRLGGQRICKPASVWAEERRAAREQIERSQINRGVGGPNG